MTECPRCLFTEDIARMGETQCEYCQLHDDLERHADPLDLCFRLKQVRRSGRGKQYDCVIGISGGLDSTLLLYTAVRKWNLRPLVIHFDNGWNRPEAELNMQRIVELLGVNSITYRVNKQEYDNLNKAFLWAGTPDMDIPNDIAMNKLMYDTAHKYGISYILNGHDFRTEGSTPAAWTYMDARYIQDVYSRYMGVPMQLVSYPLFSFKDQLLAGLRGIKQLRPFHYIKDRRKLEAALMSEMQWTDYGGKHNENIYTAWIGSVVLPVKFGIDKRRVYLSARIRSGMMSKAEAKVELLKKPDLKIMNLIPDHYKALSASPKRDRKEFDRYNFKRYKPLIWLLAKMNVVPETFFRKYTR